MKVLRLEVCVISPSFTTVNHKVTQIINELFFSSEPSSSLKSEELVHNSDSVNHTTLHSSYTTSCCDTSRPSITHCLTYFLSKTSHTANSICYLPTRFNSSSAYPKHLFFLQTCRLQRAINCDLKCKSNCMSVSSP